MKQAALGIPFAEFSQDRQGIVVASLHHGGVALVQLPQQGPSLDGVFQRGEIGAAALSKT